MLARMLAELVAYAKAQKGKLNYAVAAGMGSASHLAGVMYAQRNGIEWGYVPYKGGAQARPSSGNGSRPKFRP